MSYEPRTYSELLDEYKKLSEQSQAELDLELAVNGNLDLSPDLFENAKNGCMERHRKKAEIERLLEAARVTNGPGTSQKSPAEKSEASEAPAEPGPAGPAPKPAYGPSAKIKEIPEWIKKKYEVHEEDLPEHGRPIIFPLDHYRPEGPKAPDPRLKLREQAIEEIRKKCGYDKLPVKEKRVEKEIEDQAGTSGSPQTKKKLTTETEKLRVMDFGPKAGGSLRDIEARSSTPLDQRKMREESMDHPKLSMSNRVARKSKDLEPSVSSTAFNAPIPNESKDLEPDMSSDASTVSDSSLEDQSDVSECSQATQDVPKSRSRRSTVQRAEPKEDPFKCSNREAIQKIKRTPVSIMSSSKKAKFQLSRNGEPTEGSGSSEASEDFIEPLDLEIPAAPNNNGIDNSKQAPAKPDPAKPAYGPSAKIKEIPEWIMKYKVHEEDLPVRGRPWILPLDHYRSEGPKAPDPRLKLREQDIEKIRKKCGYDKLPVKEKKVEMEIEDQAGPSGSSQTKKKLTTEAEKLRAMDFGPKAGGSFRDIEAKLSKRVAKESKDLEPDMSSAASLASVSSEE
ncbi:hypothetical protein B9Z55_022804 [Caenorhabditis nigoni]|nr:hypothetical protein B9Z55_022804 [Caenorhabditis nigoni]